MVAAFEPNLRRLSSDGGSLAPRPDGTLTVASAVGPAVLTTTIAALTVLKLAEQSFSPFLYFQF